MKTKVIYEEDKETKEYEKELKKYLGEGINYQATGIKNSDQGDLEQLAADSFCTGWYLAKGYKVI